MPCTSCGVEFGIFKKEHSCKNCGFTFCSNCLSKKAIIPKLGNGQSKHSVCNRCYESLNSKSDSSENGSRISPPLALQKRMNALQEKLLKENSTDEDKEIASRLQKLKDERKGSVPTTKELEERLARLKGFSPEATTQPTQVFKAEKRTATEQANSLFDQMREEVVLDMQRPKPEVEIANRLARLKQDDQPWNDLNKGSNLESQPESGESYVAGSSSSETSTQSSFKPDILMNLPNNISGDYSNVDNLDEVKKLMEETSKQVQIEAKKAMMELAKDREIETKLNQIKVTNKNYNANLCVDDDDSEDEDKLADKLIEKMLTEEAIDSATAELLPKESNSSPSEDMEELPWCNICNEDATLRCYGCDGDLYCHRCFKQCHDKFDLKDHRTTRFKAPATN